MMFDQQQKTNSSFFDTQNLDNSSPESAYGLKDVQASFSEGSGNSYFPSKIS